MPKVRKQRCKPGPKCPILILGGAGLLPKGEADAAPMVSVPPDSSATMHVRQREEKQKPLLLKKNRKSTKKAVDIFVNF